MKNWIVYHYTYKDVCGDSWYGKESKIEHIAVVNAKEEDVKQFIAELNQENNSYYSKSEPEDEYDNDFVDEDYYGYKELEVITLDQLTDMVRL